MFIFNRLAWIKAENLYGPTFPAQDPSSKVKDHGCLKMLSFTKKWKIL